MRREAAFSVARFAFAGLALAPAFGGDLLSDLRSLLARDVPLAFGFAILGRSIPVHGVAAVRTVSLSTPA
jgi:hypothetical protein